MDHHKSQRMSRWLGHFLHAGLHPSERPAQFGSNESDCFRRQRTGIGLRFEPGCNVFETFCTHQAGRALDAMRDAARLRQVACHSFQA